MTIEIFTGGRRSFRGEGAVLTVIEGILRAQGEDAVILRNVRVVVPHAETKRTAEIDLFVATTRVTLAIQVKNYRLRVLGGVTGDWTSPDAKSDSSRANAWEDALEGAYALQNVVTGIAGTTLARPLPVVLFARGIPDGSQLPYGVNGVVICGPDELAELLAGTHSRAQAWSLDLVRDFATKNRLGSKVASEPNRAWRQPPQSPRAVAHTAVVAPPPRPVAPVESAGVSRPPSMPTYTVEQHRSVYRSESVKSSGSFFRSRKGWLWLALILLVIAFLVGRGKPAQNRTDQLARAEQPANTQHRNQAKGRDGSAVARSHRGTASQRSSVKTEDVTLYGGPKVTPLPSAPAAAVQQQPALPLPPCPKGVDRLGCVPDAETVRRLGGAG